MDFIYKNIVDKEDQEVFINAVINASKLLQDDAYSNPNIDTIGIHKIIDDSIAYFLTKTPNETYKRYHNMIIEEAYNFHHLNIHTELFVKHIIKNNN